MLSYGGYHAPLGDGGNHARFVTACREADPPVVRDFLLPGARAEVGPAWADSIPAPAVRMRGMLAFHLEFGPIETVVVLLLGVAAAAYLVKLDRDV